MKCVCLLLFMGKPKSNLYISCLLVAYSLSLPCVFSPFALSCPLRPLSYPSKTWIDLSWFPCVSISAPISPSLCPVEGQWLEWGPWSRCSVTCNTGTEQRQRRCSASVHGWAECKGTHQESRDCTNPSCSGKVYKSTLSIHTHVLSNAIMYYLKASVWFSLIRIPHTSNFWVGTQFGVRVCFDRGSRRTKILVCFNEPGAQKGLPLT